MNSPGKIITLDAAEAINKHRIIAIGEADYEAVRAGGPDAPLIGVATEVSANAGGRVDVILNGAATVEYGGNVSRGALLTSNAQGRAVTASDGDTIIGRALISGANGDYGSAIIFQGQLPEDPS